MATFSEALKDLVNSLTGVTALIGALPTMRYYPVRLPQTSNPVYPAITYQRIDDPLGYSHDGYDGLAFPRMQLTIWSTTYASGEALEAVLRQSPPNGLNGYRGTIDGVKFDRIFVNSGITDFEPTTQVHQRTIDLLIGYVA
jgi:hypothetical protein